MYREYSSLTPALFSPLILMVTSLPPQATEIPQSYLGRPQGCGMTRFVNDGFSAVNHHPRILTFRCVPEASHAALSMPECKAPTHCQGHQLQHLALVHSGSSLNCLVKVANRMQRGAPHLSWTLTHERYAQSCHSAKSIPLPNAG